MAQHVSYAEASNRVDAIVHSSELLFESAKMAIQAAGLPSVA
jgi:hypothetical protein